MKISESPQGLKGFFVENRAEPAGRFWNIAQKIRKGYTLSMLLIQAIVKTTGSRLTFLIAATRRERLPCGSRLTAHGSRLTAHGSRLTAHGSRLTAHGSRLTAHGSRLTII
ncbi:MAG: hypothetical protein LBK08_00725, partial [Treponema sp.]|nr:hypothetical protein [Treponema sp.]